ncbi:MAG: 1-deoxy-D-xylulose-5-phosphate synthase [Paludibacteraceae bacterium]|nr:1-deoxy-D-xylulose-5-phosphate synthase [Paludibacteraceae bacterium]
MEYKYLHTINYPSDLKALPLEALPQVCAEVRDFIIQQLSQNPGHLGSSLGTVELTVALHYVFDTPNDQLVWDVGHQAYAHKILTGRRERFHTNRQFKGIAPFPTPAESEYDAFIAGHASNSISAALGIAVGQEAKRQEGEEAKGKRRVVAIIGDGAMTGGLAFEGLNNTSMLKNNLLIVLNDNNMAIDPIKGGFTQYLLDITTSKRYNKWRWGIYRLARKLHLINDSNKGQVQRFANNLKAMLTKQPSNIFQGLNIRYFGPADGHDVQDLVRIFQEIKDYEGPKVLHIITKKGKGYEPAENDQTTWHAPGEFCAETGERLKAKGERQEVLWQEVFGEQLLALAKNDERVVGVTPAMPSGCSMTIMQKEIPDRVYDVGIAEGHAVTFSAGLAKAGLVPYCNIYSSFLQRAYDNIIHDVALPKLHVVFCIDRAGIVGNDGATHHGLLDLAFLRPIPNMAIGAPMTANDLRQMMRIAKDYDGPIAIRYPRGKSVNRTDLPPIVLGQAVCVKPGKEVAVLSIGAIGNTVAEAIQSMNIGKRNLFAHYDMRWLKPIDEYILKEVVENFDTIVTVEDGMIHGGLGSAVAEYVGNRSASPEVGRSASPEDGRQPRVIRLGVNDQFVEHGSTKELYELLKLDKEGICESLLQALEQ